MEFIRKASIDKPIDVVWNILGNQFGDAYKWASSLNYSEEYGKPELKGATCSNRACDTTQGKIKERLIILDHDKHILSYEVIEGFPFFVQSGVNRWQLFNRGNVTQLEMKCNITNKGIIGSMMKPMMKMQMNKLFDEAVEDFKYYVENDGNPHPRKAKQLLKKAV